ncbi:hypothetical protein KSAC_18680 [Komagataeibacter saccharivorans]|uniref:hypothetical protein n=1 Tax=Komagataeibacter saccharivorans TaxID=265959 RepID=UPI001051962A|nr:hypothetical protein [Komagataeibacter saccharivorans]QBL94078.1 hypothetical protein KSAC_18680 [Komagataeibacter saccharivorans]
MIPEIAFRPAGLLGLDMGCTAAGLLVGCLLVLAVQAVLYRAWPERCVLLRGLMLALVLPGLGLALWWPAHMGMAGMVGSGMQGICLAPAAMWPLLRVLDRIPSGLVRTASGLGADMKARMRLLWLPLLGGPVAGVTAFSIIMIALCAMVAVARS